MKHLATILVLCIISLGGVQSATALEIPTETQIGALTVGTWDGSTYTLTQDVFEGLVIVQDNLTFDGAGNSIQGSGMGVVLPGVTNVTIMDANFTECGSYGIYLDGASDCTLIGNTVSNNTSNGGGGVFLYASSNNTIRDNTIRDNFNGVVLQVSNNNRVYNNNFIDNTSKQAEIMSGAGNVFNLAAPIGGNYWEGASTIGPELDELPWASLDGWLNSTPTNNAPVALAQDVEVDADSAGLANVTAEDVNNGSSDPDGDSITLSLTPEGPYGKGIHTLTLTVTDGDLTATAEATVTVVDVTAPVMALNGDASMVLPFGDTYAEPGAMAVDNCDDFVPVTIAGDVVDTTVCGVYTVTYDAVDEAGNAAAQLTRTVKVEAAPVIAIEIDLLTDTLWPPNNKLVHVANISALDLGDAVLNVDVTSDEGIRVCDWVWNADTGQLYLRARRNGYGDGRVYSITASADDGSSGPVTATAEVTVPHDQCENDQDDEDDDDDRKGRKKGKKDKGKGGKKDKGRNRGGRRR